jgi:single-strand DNA-binding protein
MYNKVILVGNLTRDVELKYLSSGSSVAKFGLATNRKWKDKNSGDDRQEVMFIDISVFGRSAEIANQYLRKGSKVLIEGRLVLNQWTDQNGQKRSKHEIQADNVQFMDTKAEANQQSGGNWGNNNGGSYNNNTYNEANMGNQPNNNSYNQQPQSQPSTPRQENRTQDIDIENEDIPF